MLSTKRKLLALLSAGTGSALLGQWQKPVIRQTILPAHAETTQYVLTIENLSFDFGPNCVEDQSRFNLSYDYESSLGAVSHIITTANCNGTLTYGDGDFTSGSNLWTSDQSDPSVSRVGDEFQGSMSITDTSGRVVASDPEDVVCTVVITLTDAEGNTVSDSLLIDCSL